MKIKIIYESKTGNTKMIAESLKEVCEKDNDVIFTSVKQALEDKNKDEETALFFLGSWTDKGECGEEMKEYCKTLDQEKVAIFGTAGFGGSQEYYKKLSDRFASALPNSNKVLGSFYCQGKMPIGVKDRFESMLKENPEDKDLKVSIDNFDDAKSHPNEKDLEDMKIFAHLILKSI